MFLAQEHICQPNAIRSLASVFCQSIKHQSSFKEKDQSKKGQTISWLIITA